MLGRKLEQEDPAVWKEGSVWVHAVSVGEVIAAQAMLPLLKERFPNLPLLLTTHTETGQAQARRLHANGADEVRYYPADLSWVVRRFARTYRPRLFIPMETELWPNALNIFHEMGTKTFVLNGKISERSFRSYSRLKPVFRHPLSRISAFCVQTEADKERIESLTDRASPVVVTGNCKFDVPAPEVSSARLAELRRLVGVGLDQPVVVVGSTHPGEEEIVLQAWQRVAGEIPGATMLLVPRHPERFDGVWDHISRSGFAARRLSNGSMSGDGPASIILIDQMGLLSELYALSTASVVAGSFVEGIGGHNLMEAAIHGVPVVYGPHMRQQPDMKRILSPENGGTVAVTAEELAEALLLLLSDRQEGLRRGMLGRTAFERNRGAAQRNMEVINSYL